MVVPLKNVVDYFKQLINIVGEKTYENDIKQGFK